MMLVQIDVGHLDRYSIHRDTSFNVFCFHVYWVLIVLICAFIGVFMFSICIDRGIVVLVSFKVSFRKLFIS